MTSLISIIPDVDVLLALAPEELSGVVLKVAHDHKQNSYLHIQTLMSEINGNFQSQNHYPENRREEVKLAVAEAWNWLIVQGLIIPVPDSNGDNGWKLLTRRGRDLLSNNSFKTYARSIAFPKSLLHQSVADEVWLDIVRGDVETAVFKSFREVEIAVRKAGNFSATDVGTDLMRKAFHKDTGLLTDKSKPDAEREALAHLFAGAIGSYKNPHSHRTVTISDPSEAQEMVILASHLLRIVNSRKNNNKP